MVDTKDQRNAIVYWVGYLVCWQCRHRYHWMVCWHCRHEDQSMQCIECYVCWHSGHWCLWILHNTLFRLMKCENCILLCIKCIESVNIDSIEYIRDPCLVLTVSTYYIILIVWLKTPKSPLSKTFCGLKIGWILRKLWAGMCGCVLFLQCWHR